MSLENPDSSTGVVYGLLKGIDGSAISKAKITVTDNLGRQIAHVVGDEQGNFRLVLPTSICTMVISAPGYRPLARHIVGIPGSSRREDIILESSNVINLPEPGIWKIDPEHSSIVATATHLRVSQIKGHFNKFAGQITIGYPGEPSQVDVTIEASSLDTANKQRDAHLHSPDFLSSQEFPFISYKASLIAHLDWNNRFEIQGDLTIRDITRPVALQVHYKGQVDDPWGYQRIGFSAVGEIFRQDFDMKWNQVLDTGEFVVSKSLMVEIDVEAFKVLSKSTPK